MGADDPPKLEKDTVYSVWKRDVKIWQLGTSVATTKQAARVVLKMSGKVRDFANRISLDELGSARGLDDLLKQLDNYYRKDVTQELFLSIENLENYRRDVENETIAEYIEEFGRRNDRVKELIGNKDAYDDGVLAYRLLKQSSLSESDRKLVRATVTKLTFEEMVNGLKRCLGDGAVITSANTSRSQEISSLKIKSEPMENFHAREYQQEWDYDKIHQHQHNEREEEVYYQNNRRFSGYGKYRGRGRNNNHQGERGNYYQNNYRRPHGDSRYHPKNNYRRPSGDSSYQERNDLDDPITTIVNSKNPRTGDFLRCHVCESKYHFARGCPDKHRRNSGLGGL